MKISQRAIEIMNKKITPEVIFYLSDDKVYAFFYNEQKQSYEINKYQGDESVRCTNQPDKLFRLVDYHLKCLADRTDEIACLSFLSKPAVSCSLISENRKAVESVAYRVKGIKELCISECDVISSLDDFLIFISVMCCRFKIKQTILCFNDEYYMTPSYTSDYDEQAGLQRISDFESSNLDKNCRVVTIDDSFIIHLLCGSLSDIDMNSKQDLMLPATSSAGVNKNQNLLQKIIGSYGKTDV